MAAFVFPNLDPVIFEIGPFAVRWYGMAYVFGFVGAAYVFYVVAKRWRVQMSPDDVLNLLLASMVGVVAGGRLFYVLFYGAGRYLDNPADIFSIWDGGMAWHGGFVGIVVAGLIYARVKGIPFVMLADLAAAGAPIGFFFGRVANFVNMELWGRETDLPWGVVFGGSAGTVPRHPSQLYEALLEGLVMFAVLLWLARKQRPPGLLFGLFMLMYGTFRFLIEFAREPDVQIGFLWSWVTMGQLLSLPLIAAGGWFVWRALRMLQTGWIPTPERTVRS